MGRVTPIYANWKDVQRELERPLPLPVGIACSYADHGFLADELRRRGICIYTLQPMLAPRVQIAPSRVLDRGEFHIFESHEEMRDYCRVEEDVQSQLWSEARARMARG